MTLIVDDSLNAKIALFVSKVAGENVIIQTSLTETEDIVLPAFIPSNKTGVFVSCGLCNVVRQIVKHSVRLENNDSNQENLELLLGYKQNCLKGCAAISNWTNFCEKDFPSAVLKLMKTIDETESSYILPEEFVQLEKELTVPKKTANAMKHNLAGRGYQLVAENAMDLDIVKKVITDIGLSVDSDSCSNKRSDSSSPILKSSEEMLKRKNQIYWPYLCGFDITIADLLILGYTIELLFNMPCFCVRKEFFTLFPNIFRWFSQSISRQSILNAVNKTWTVIGQNICPHLHLPIFDAKMDLDSIFHISFERKFNTKQMHTKITKLLPSLLTKLSDNEINPKFETEHKFESIPWMDYPDEINPAEGELNSDRALRKRQQIENLVSHVLPLLKSGDKLVEFCAGGGHLGIVIAYLRPDCKIILLENKEESIDRASARIKKLKLTNVSLQLSNLEYFDGVFNVGVALHACGSATDLVLHKCLKYSASFVICPCCYGGIRASKTLPYPQSKRYQSCSFDENDFTILSHSADQTSSNYDNDYSKQGKQCMLFVDYDRTLKAVEDGGYRTQIFSMIPETCSPKNNIIMGKRIE